MEGIIVNVIAAIVVILILGGAVMYIFKVKKSGQKCIGCPYSKTCAASNSTDKTPCSCSKTE